MHILVLGLYSHLKEFWGNEVRTHVNSEGKISSTGKILLRRGSNSRRCIKQDSEPNTLPTELFRPQQQGRLLPFTMLVGQPHSQTQSLDKKLDGAYTKMLRVVRDMTWQKHITNEVLYAGLPRISTTVQERRLRFTGHCWKIKNEVVRDLVLWEPKHGKRSIGGRARTIVDLLEADTGVPRDCLPAAMDDRDGWRNRAMRGWGRGGGGGLLHSQHIHTHMVFSMKEAASGATLPIPSTLSITTNSDSLVEFFIHPCKFLKYSISFSFNKIKFLLSPKIHD